MPILDPRSLSTASLPSPTPGTTASRMPPALLGALSALVTMLLTATLLALVLGGCTDLEVAADTQSDEPPAGPGELAAMPLTSPCPGSDRAFAFRALRLIQGRRPYGIRELDLLAQIVRKLDAAGLAGRELVARGLAHGERYREHWQGTMLDLLRVPRIGPSADYNCYGRTSTLAKGPELANWLQHADPTELPPGPLKDWTMADLLDSSLAADDLRPLLRAHLIMRNARPLGGNNVDPVNLERARRVFLGRGFEAAFLGRRLECIACHDGSGETVLDSLDPESDRTWPVIHGLEDMVYGSDDPADESSAYAVFRFAGVMSRGAQPWGASDECPRLALTSADEGPDPLAQSAYLGGPLGSGATVIDLEDTLDRGLQHLHSIGLNGGEHSPESALAAMVALHLADATWRQATGHRLTMSHGQPRRPISQAVLRGLSAHLVNNDFSLRELLVAVAIHPLLDLDEPNACGPDLPAIFDAFANQNDIGDLIRREEPWRLLDSAAIALDWPKIRRFPPPSSWSDEALVRALGAFIDETEPGHRSIDVVAALAWEAAIGDGIDPGWGAQTDEQGPDFIDRIVELALLEPSTTVEDLVVAIEDRLLQENTLMGPDQASRDDRRTAIETLLQLPLEGLLAELVDDAASTIVVTDGLRRFAGVLLATPQFTLAGLPPKPSQHAPPRLVLPEATTQALCDALAPPIVDPLAITWRCDEYGLVLDNGSA
ncbi:MAG TPA: hypothetical protein ENJ18_10840 [Nannocystis exedens]|nr:hypothetical protein [Nannocystis exedens]